MRANCETYNVQDLSQKNGVCPWDAIEIHVFDEGVERSAEFYAQPPKPDAEASASA
jgi:hypothetical protein